MATMVVGCNDADLETGNAYEQTAAAPERPAAVGEPRAMANVFYSGHSLLDQPLPDYVQKIAESLNIPNQWNRQYLVGSSIQLRTQGVGPSAPGWRGYREGYNRDGEGLNIIAELRSPKTIDGIYDVLVITEEHTMLDTLIQSNTIRLLRHYHEQFVVGNPAGTTYFYEPWFNVDEKADPRRWIAYERAASPIWQCMATRINVALEREGRSDRIVSLPAGLALAALVERATQDAGLLSITRGTVLETVDSLVGDNVHLRPLGVYYVSLVTYASIFKKTPKGAWYPDGVTREQAHTLQDFAWGFVSRYYENYRPLSLEQCRDRLSTDEGIAPLWLFIREAYWRKEMGALRSYVRYRRRVGASKQLFTARSAENPFYFEPSADAAYWYPPVGDDIKSPAD